MNPGSYAVSDCDLGIAFSGQVNEPGIIDLDLTSLSESVNNRGFCFLKIEAIERWGDGRELPLAGGFIIEAFRPGYIPTPPREVIAWCMKFGRTTAGRTISEKCTQ